MRSAHALPMSVRSDVAVCRHCGLVQLVSRMVRIEGGEYTYLCHNCAMMPKSVIG